MKPKAIMRRGSTRPIMLHTMGMSMITVKPPGESAIPARSAE